MRRTLLTAVGAATLLAGLPLAGAAHDDHRGSRGHERHGYYPPPKLEHPPRFRPHYYQPRPVYYQPRPVVYYPAPPRVVQRPVYVPVLAPLPPPRPWPFHHVDIGFRVFF